MMDDRWRLSSPAARLIVVGAALGLVGGATHGDLPEGSGAAALQFVADHPAYALVHFVSILGAILWATGLAELARTDDYWAGRAAGRIALVGAAVLAVQFSLDGVGLEAMARHWASPGADTALFERMAEIAPDILVGTAFTWVMILYGLPPVLVGWSLITTGRHVLGWIGIVVGTLSFTGALLLALGASFILDAIVFAGATIGVNLWLIAINLDGRQLQDGQA